MLFFVSVGMLFDPTVLVREPLAVLAVLAIIMVGKSLAAFVIVLAFRHPVRTALTVSASLAQIGEFSFILAGLGGALGLLPPDGRDLILAGALLSIALNPVTFAGVAPLTRWLEARPRLLALLERRGAERHRTPVSSTRRAARPRDRRRLRPRRRRHRPGAQGAGPAVRGHRARSPDAGARAGAGRSDHRRRRLRARRAARPPASNTRACSWWRRPTASRRGASSSWRASSIPRIDIVVRTHSEGEFEALEALGAGRVVMGERELARGMLEYALRSLGVPPASARRGALAGPRSQPGESAKAT